METREILRREMADGRTATLSLTPEATVLALDEATVSSYDLAGRAFVLVRDGSTSRRALSGTLLQKRAADAEAPRGRRRLSAEAGAEILEAARREAAAVLGLLSIGPPAPEPPVTEARRRLAAIVAMDAAALREDSRRFAAACGPVGILPPDQYLSVVIRLTEGCSWNACTFCSFYRDVPFRVKTVDELRSHMASVRAYFGESFAMRRRVFLGDANALCLSHDRLVPLMEAVATVFPSVPDALSLRERRSWLGSHEDAAMGLFAFVDAWTGQRKGVSEWARYRSVGLRRVYVGLESGDGELLSWLNKAGRPEDAVHLVESLQGAGLDAGVIVLLGAGGERFDGQHVERTAEVLRSMHLGPSDILYFSPVVEGGPLHYGPRRDEKDLAALPRDRCLAQRKAILELSGYLKAPAPPKVATYDVEEFLY